MSDVKKSITLTKRDKEFHIDADFNGQELYEALVALIGYVRGHPQYPSHILFVCGAVRISTTRLMRKATGRSKKENGRKAERKYRKVVCRI